MLLIQEDPGFLYGANFSGETPLYMAAERGFTDLVKVIIQNTTQTPPAHTGPMGRTALHAAVICRQPSTHVLFQNSFFVKEKKITKNLCCILIQLQCFCFVFNLYCSRFTTMRSFPFSLEKKW